MNKSLGSKILLFLGMTVLPVICFAIIDKPIIDKPIKPIETVCTEGTLQYRPNPNDDCKTQERICCNGGLLLLDGAVNWSDWDKDCPVILNCLINQCSDGSKCVAKPVGKTCLCINGTCKEDFRCLSGSGWQSIGNVCTCKTGYEMRDGSCQIKKGCVYKDDLTLYYYDGSSYISKPTELPGYCMCTNGNCSKSWSCNNSSGWVITQNCTCLAGYIKSSSGECVKDTKGIWSCVNVGTNFCNNNRVFCPMTAPSTPGGESMGPDGESCTIGSSGSPCYYTMPDYSSITGARRCRQCTCR